MKITDIECHVLLAPDMSTGSTSSAQDSFIVIIRTDEGISGLGEFDVNPWIAKACIEAPGTHTMGLGIKDMLIGADPLQTEELWRKMYVGTAMNGRRGAVIHAMGAIDMALWDIRGKVEGKPIFELLGGAEQAEVIPYASLQPSGNRWEEYRDSLCIWAERAKGLGFKAVKAEVTMNGPYAHDGMREPYEKHTRVVEAVRKALGKDIALMIDVQYMWPDAETALRTIRDWAEFDIFFLETPLWIDKLDDYARLHHEAPMPIAAGEWQTTRYEFEELMDRGKVDVAQPDIGRVGGFGEAKASVIWQRNVAAYNRTALLEDGYLGDPPLRIWRSTLPIAALLSTCRPASVSMCCARNWRRMALPSTTASSKSPPNRGWGRCLMSKRYGFSK